MLLMCANQFNDVEEAKWAWVNTVAKAAESVWKVNPKTHYSDPTVGGFAAQVCIAHIAKTLWQVTEKDRLECSKIGYDYNNLAEKGYNKDYCDNLLVDAEDSDVFQQKLERLVDDKAENDDYEDFYGVRDLNISLNFIIAAANVYAYAISNNWWWIEPFGILDSLKYLPQITKCSLDFIHNSVKCLPLTITDVRMTKYYENKHNPVIASKRLFDYIRNLIMAETPNITYIISDDKTKHLQLGVSDESINTMLADPMGIFKISIYGLVASPLKRLVNYPIDQCYNQALIAFDTIDKHFTNLTERATFYNQLLQLVEQKSLKANQTLYRYRYFDKTCVNEGKNIDLYKGYDEYLYNSKSNIRQFFAIKAANNLGALWTNVKNVARILQPDVLTALFTLPCNMWETLLDSNSDEVDETLGKLELALYNAISLYSLIISEQQGWSASLRKYKIGGLKNIFNPVFRNIKITITDNELIINRLSLKMQKYYSLFTQDDDPKCEKNRQKFIKQINQVLEWLEFHINDYNRTKNPNIIIYRIFR